MAIKAFMGMGERAGTAAAEEGTSRPSPAAPAARTVAPSTSVDASSELEGTLRCKETLRIDGRVKGEVECEKTVLVGERAQIAANISADEVKISGLVEGNILARRKITLERTAVVTGDLTTPGIVIEEGAKLRGRITIGSDGEAAAAAESAKASKAPAQAQAPRKPQAASPKAEETPKPQPVSATG